MPASPASVGASASRVRASGGRIALAPEAKPSATGIRRLSPVLSALPMLTSGRFASACATRSRTAGQSGEGAKKLGRVLVGTVHGDLHDIGKNIVSFMLDINGYEVKDIGIDVPVATFLDEVRSFKPDVVALSGFLTLAFDSMKETVEAFEKEGLRDQFKIMVGGGQIDETVRAYTGADGFGVNAVEAVNLCNRWLGVAA